MMCGVDLDCGLVGFVDCEVVAGVELLCVECGDEHWLS